MENISQGSGDVRVDATTTVPALHPNDVELIARWGASLLGAGYAAPSVERAQKTLRAFARRLPDGLLVATRGDVWAFLQDRQRALRQRQGTSAVAPVRLSLLRRPSWAIFVRSAKRFYGWLEARNLVSPTTNPFKGIREYPSTSPVGVGVRADCYDQVLHHPSLNRREAALLWLLAHGLAPSEVRLLGTNATLSGRDASSAEHAVRWSVMLGSRASLDHPICAEQH